MYFIVTVSGFVNHLSKDGVVCCRDVKDAKPFKKLSQAAAFAEKCMQHFGECKWYTIVIAIK